MARKTFIYYKYSEAQDLRDQILDALGDDATYYQGETADSPDLTDTSTENIRKNLTDMMYDTSVTIVIVSPDVKASKWIDWEIEYSLKPEFRQDNSRVLKRSEKSKSYKIFSVGPNKKLENTESPPGGYCPRFHELDHIL